jgi:hypothetical protein
MTINITVNNPDIRGLCERIDRVRYEILKSGSANIDEIRQAVRKRIDEWNAGLQTYADVISAEPEQDYPKSYPMEYVVRLLVTPDITNVENLEIRDLDVLYSKMLVEMSNSASARRESGIKEDDKERFDAYMKRVDDFMVKFVDEVNPQDFPESSPSEVSITDGYSGINAGE